MIRLPASSWCSRVPGGQVGEGVVGSGVVVVVVVLRVARIVGVGRLVVVVRRVVVVVRRVVVRRVVVVVGSGVVVVGTVVVCTVVVVVVGGMVVVGGWVVVLITSKPTKGFPPRLKMGLSWALATGLPCLPCPKRGRPSGLTIGAPPRSEIKPSERDVARQNNPEVRKHNENVSSQSLCMPML